MEQLRFTAVHEDGQHLVLSTADGTELLLPVDARLRSALRSRSAPADTPATPLSPRNVQAMIRAGQSPEEVAEITGWPAERVARFEGPILAEREHISGRAQAAHVRGRAPEGGVPTLGSRVLDRLAERGVDTDNVGWDATRPEGGVWTVVVTFVAGQRQRAAAWRFDPVDRTVEALDDEARWLSEDEQALPGIAAAGPSRGHASAKPLLSKRTSAGEVELMTSMRERSRSRGRRKKTSTSSSDPAGLPQLEHAPEDVLPLEDLAYDPDTMGLPPAAHGESPAPEAAAEPAPAEQAPEGQSAGESPTEPAITHRAPASSATEQISPEHASTTKDGAADDRGSATVDQGSGRTDYDVPLQFDNDEESLDEPEADLSPREATLEDLFGPEDEDDESHDDEPDDESDADEPDDESHDDEPDDESRDAAASVDTDSPAIAADDTAEVQAEEPTEATSDAETGPADEAEPAPDVEPEATDTTTKAAAKPKRRKDGRPGVPSWDDIMFGAKDRRG